MGKFLPDLLLFSFLSNLATVHVYVCVCTCICACVGVCVCVHSPDHRESSEDFERESGSSTNRHVVGEQLEEERLGVGLGASLRRRMPSYEAVVTCAAT